MIPVPFACNPGDKLRVTADHPYGTALVVGDLVTVTGTGVWIENGRPIPVVKVSTAHGPQTLGLDAVEPYTVPTYTPAEPDDVTDAFLVRMISADPELSHVFAQVETDLSAMDSAVDTLTDAEPEQPTRRAVGKPYSVTDADGDELDVTYFEQDCPDHGREGLFHFMINEEEEVVIPAKLVDGLIRYLFQMKKHSERPPE